VEEVIKNDNFVLSMKHIKPRRRLRGSVETLFAVDFPGSQQKFVLMLDRRSKRGKPVPFLYEVSRDTYLGFTRLDDPGLYYPLGIIGTVPRAYDISRVYEGMEGRKTLKK
jgi:hypothetical protein